MPLISYCHGVFVEFRADDEDLQDNPGGKKTRSKGKHRANPYPSSGHAKKVTLESESASGEAQDATMAKNKDVAREARPDVQSSMPSDVIVDLATSVHKNVVVEGANAQPSTPVTDAIVQAVKYVSVESVNVPSLSPVLVNALMEHVTLPLSPHPQDDCFKVARHPLSRSSRSSLRVGHVKSQKHIYGPTARSKAKSRAEDNDRKRAMLEEAAKNIPVLKLRGDLSFTNSVGHFTTSIFFD